MTTTTLSDVQALFDRADEIFHRARMGTMTDEELIVTAIAVCKIKGSIQGAINNGHRKLGYLHDRVSQMHVAYGPTRMAAP